MKWLMKVAFMLGSRNKKGPYGAFFTAYKSFLQETKIKHGLKATEQVLEKIVKKFKNSNDTFTTDEFIK